MQGLALAVCILARLTLGALASNVSQPLTSRIILPRTFRPSPVFRNVNLLRNINLEKGYVRELVNVVIENVASSPQDEYFLPFPSEIVDRVGGIEVRDKKNPGKGVLEAALVEYDPYQTTQFYRIRLPDALKPSEQQTLSISYATISSLQALPASIEQGEAQYLVYTFSAYSPSAYTTIKQKTKLKLPTTDIPEYTSLPAKGNLEGKDDPQRQGTTFTYGPYGDIPAGAQEQVKVRYEFTKPLTHVSLLERDLEISHWGGNLATEERYWLTNKGATLLKHFSRTSWVHTAYYSPPTRALKELKIPLKAGAMDAYFTDDIGNVSTSHFRSGAREASLEIKPRYPVFGGWKYSFRVGWNADLQSYLRRPSRANKEGYVLKVPFLEGPKQPEGIAYEKVQVRIILPEGATNIKHYIPPTLSILSTEHTLHRTFLDTLGRTTIKLNAVNMIDDQRDQHIIVSYDLPLSARLRKPTMIFSLVFALFLAAWLLGRLDVRILVAAADPRDRERKMKGKL